MSIVCVINSTLRIVITSVDNSAHIFLSRSNFNEMCGNVFGLLCVIVRETLWVAAQCRRWCLLDSNGGWDVSGILGMSLKTKRKNSELHCVVLSEVFQKSKHTHTQLSVPGESHYCGRNTEPVRPDLLQLETQGCLNSSTKTILLFTKWRVFKRLLDCNLVAPLGRIRQEM